MEQLQKQYRILTNREPGQMFYVGEETSQAMVDSVSGAPKNEYEFVDLVKTSGHLKVTRITDLHKTDGHYVGSSILLGSSCPVELTKSLKELKDGDFVTLVMYGKNLKELSTKRKKLFKVDDADLRIKRDTFFNTLDQLAVTDGFLAKHTGSVYQSDNGNYAAVGFPAPGKAGLHMRPSAMVVKLLSPYDCTCLMRSIQPSDDGKLRVASAKSLMGMLVLEAGAGSKLVCAANGPQAYDAIKDLSKLVASRDFY